MTATDKLRRLLDENGVEWMPSVWSAKDETFYKVGEVGYLATELSSGRMKVCIEGYPTPEQAIAAALGSGTLTADDVREAVMSVDRWEKPMDSTGLTNAHLIIRDDGWQAIADELNATITSRAERTCHVNELDALTQTLSMVDGRPWGECSECGCLTPIGSRFCVECGARVEGEA